MIRFFILTVNKPLCLKIINLVYLRQARRFWYLVSKKRVVMWKSTFERIYCFTCISRDKTSVYIQDGNGFLFEWAS